MEIQQAKLFHQELKRVENSANNSRSITMLVAVGLIAYAFFVGFFLGFGMVLMLAALVFCGANWFLNARRAKKYTEALDSYCWSNLGKSYSEAKYEEFLL